MSEATVVRAFYDDQIVLASERKDAIYYRIGPRVSVKMRKDGSTFCGTCKSGKPCCHSRRLKRFLFDNPAS